MNTNKNAVAVRMPDGTLSTQVIDSFVNSRTAMIEATRSMPLHKTTLVPVHTSRDDYADIKGKTYLKHSARCRLASAAGVREAGSPIWETFEQDGKTFHRVSIALIRPPLIMDPVWGQADGCEQDQKAHEREHYKAKLATRAHARALKKILGESFLYDQAELDGKNGMFLVACMTEDESDPDVRATLLANMSRSKAQLYGTPPKPPTPPAPPADFVDEPDPFEDAEFEDVETDPFEDIEEVAASEVPSPSTEPVVTSLPRWCGSYVRLPNGMPMWDSIPLEQTKEYVRKELKEIKYKASEDPAGLIEDGKAGRWVECASKLLAWQLKGGATNE